MKYLFTCLILSLLLSCKQNHTILGIEIARQELKQALSNTSNKQQYLFIKKGVSNASEAIAAVEPILYKTYGKDDIVNEKPYEVYLVDGYWVLSGTLPEGIMGGTFLIAFSAKNGRVITLTHGK